MSLHKVSIGKITIGPQVQVVLNDLLQAQIYCNSETCTRRQPEDFHLHLDLHFHYHQTIMELNRLYHISHKVTITLCYGIVRTKYFSTTGTVLTYTICMYMHWSV